VKLSEQKFDLFKFF